MSRATCVTCGAQMRDRDPEPEDVVLWLPEHDQPGTRIPCPEPRGDSPWNDGRHFWPSPASEHWTQHGGYIRVPSLELSTPFRHARDPVDWSVYL